MKLLTDQRVERSTQSGNAPGMVVPRPASGSSAKPFATRAPLLPWLVSFCWLLAASGALLDYVFPPNLTRLETVGTEVLDRQDRPLALLPAPGGVWRFRADPAR